MYVCSYHSVPYFPDIYNKSGFSQPNSWSTVPRAQIFKRDQGKITNLQQFQDMMSKLENINMIDCFGIRHMS